MKRPGERELSLAVVDIETIESPSIARYREFAEKAELDAWLADCEVCKNAKPKRKAPAKPKFKSDKPSTHWVTGQICCLGILQLTDESDNWKDWPAWSAVNSCERDLLQYGYDTLEDLKPSHVITYNGNEFDLPYILMAAKAYGINMSDILPKITSKYPKGYIDIHQQISKWKITAKLSDFAYKFQVHDMLYGSGKQVQAWYNKKEFDEIRKHNLGDIITTARVFNKLRGDLSWT